MIEFAIGLYQNLNQSLAYLHEALRNKLASSAKVKDYMNRTLPDIEKKEDVITGFAFIDNDFSMLLAPRGGDIIEQGYPHESELSDVAETEILFSGKRERYCYFPSMSKTNEQKAFEDVIECGIAIISAHQAINSTLFEQRLPPLNYRISADYGKVEVARSSSSQSEDLFGSTMNVCAKINAKASAYGMVIGRNLYQIIGIDMERNTILKE